MATSDRLSLSKTLWDLDWRSHGPWKLEDITVEWVPFEAALPFMREHYGAFFQTTSKLFLEEAMSPAKRRYFDLADAFLFKNATSEPVGLILANPTDWSSYYIRSAAVVPALREKTYATWMLRELFEPLRAVGVERIEADTSPLNIPVIRSLTSVGFVPTATHLSERWGALVHFTKFLGRDAKDVFTRQYTAMPFDHVAIHQQPANEGRTP